MSSTWGAEIVWTNINGGSWSTATNWSPNTVPGAADNAYITNSGVYAVTVDVSATIASLRVGGGAGTQTIVVGSTMLALNGASVLETNSVFNLSGGTLDGTGELLVKGVFTWSDGTMDSLFGGGKTIFTNTATVAINTGNTKTLYRRTVNNYTTVNWSAGQFNAGLGAVWNNYSVFDVQADLFLAYAGGGNALAFNNSGTFKKSAGAGVASFGAAVNNAGLTTCLSGTLSLNNDGVSSGSFNANSSCILNFGAGIQMLVSGANFTGSGLHRVNSSGILNFAAPITINSAFELAADGTIEGTNVVVFGGPFTWSGGAMDSLAGGGKTVFTNSATVTINTGNTKTFYRRTVDNYTTASWSAGQFNAGLGAVWNNYSVFDVQGDLFLAYAGGGNALAFNNSGTFKKSSGAGVASFGAAVNNAGLTTCLSGTLSLNSGGVSSGSFNANISCILNFGGGVQMLVTGANFTGGGLHRINSSGTLNFAAPITINPAFELAADGTIEGTNVAVFGGPFTWSGGAMDSLFGGGKTVFTNTATVTINTGNTKTFYRRTVDNYTTASWSAGQFNAGLGAVWNNYSVFDIQGDLFLAYAGGGNALAFNNSGTFKKSSGAGVANLTAAVNNANLVTCLSGTLSLNSGGVSSGSFNANISCILNFGGGVQMLVTGANFTGSGLHRINSSGTLNFAAPITINPAFELAADGTIEGTNVAVFGGPFTWSGGAMDSLFGGGKTVFTNTATVTIDTGNTKAFYRRTVDNYTTASWSAGQFNAGLGAVWNNYSVFDVQGDLFLAYAGGGNAMAFNNSGTFKKSSGAGVATLTAAVNNANLVTCLSGTLSLNSGGVSSGSFNANPSCILNFGGGVQMLVSGANFTGSGLHRINSSGTLNFAAPITINPAFELAADGTIEGTNVAVFGGPFTWSGGAMDSLFGGGKTVFTNTATVTINTGNTKTFYRRTVDNYTTASWSAGQFNAGLGAVWNNYSIFDIQGDLFLAYAGGGNALAFNNSGTFKKSSGAGVATLTAAVNNANLVTCLSGTLSLNSGGVSSGSFNANTSCILNFGGGIQMLVSGANFTGSGLHRVNSSGTVNFAAPITINPAFELAADGTIEGTNVAVFGGPFTWSGGAMDSLAGGGKTVFTNSATVTINTGNTKTFYRRTVDNYTTASWSAGQFNAGLGAVWNNYSVFDVQGDLFLAYAGGGNALAFNNSGMFKKSSGAGAATFDGNVANSGTVRSQAGLFNLPRTFVQTAGVTELAGGNFSGTLLDITGGLLTGSGNIAANVSNGGQVAPGTGVGLMTITNTIPQTYSSTSNSLVTFQLAGLAPGSGHDQLQVNSSATLAGTLRAVLTNGYIPTPGNIYTVMTFTARSGLFTNFSFPEYEFGVVQSATNVLLIASNALPVLSFNAPTSQLACVPFPITAQANDLDGQVTNVQFLLNSTVIISFTNPPYDALLSYDFPGNATLTARAYDNKGALRETNTVVNFYTLPLHVINAIGILTNGAFKFCMLGQAAKDYSVLANTNLATTNWINIGTMEVTNGIWRFSDTNAPALSRRFYRARQL